MSAASPAASSLGHREPDAGVLVRVPVGHGCLRSLSWADWHCSPCLIQAKTLKQRHPSTQSPPMSAVEGSRNVKTEVFRVVL